MTGVAGRILEHPPKPWVRPRSALTMTPEPGEALNRRPGGERASEGGPV